MKPILYFLVIVNIIILLFTWGDFNKDVSPALDEQEGETLSLIERQQIPARFLGEQIPVTNNNLNSLARFIDTVINFFFSLGETIMDMFRDDVHPLPAEPVEGPTPPLAAYCIDIGDYVSQQDSTSFQNSLAAQGVKSALKDKDIQADSFRYMITALVRADLDIAVEISELLLENGIRNRVEKRGSFYQLRTDSYVNKQRVQEELERIMNLGISSAEIVEIKKPTNRKVYFLRIAKVRVPLFERISADLSTQKGIEFKQNPDC